jgi:hypothetical protein
MIKYQIHGYDNLLNEHYIKPEIYDTYEEAFARAHSRYEYVMKIIAKAH